MELGSTGAAPYVMQVYSCSVLDVLELLLLLVSDDDVTVAVDDATLPTSVVVATAVVGAVGDSCGSRDCWFPPSLALSALLPQ